ncbi:BCL-6 corepressor [Nymphon striatum]|nr:BCL-6 corepressor [Nymphon striatum]
MMQFNALELSNKNAKKSKAKKKMVRNNVKIFKRQLRNRSVNISTKTDYEADVVKTRTKKQNGILRKVAVRRYNKNAAYEGELNKEAQRHASNRIHKRLRSGPSLRSKSTPTKTGSPSQAESEDKEYDDDEEEEDKSDDPTEEDDDKPYKAPVTKQPSVKQMVTRSAGITLQNQWQSQQKKRIVYLRKRRFRSGLDMINFHKRQKRRREMCLKKYGVNHFKERMEAIRMMKQKAEPVGTVTDGPPAELKKLMINKALGETILHRASRLGYSEVVLYCLNTNTNEVNSRDNAGYTPLHECCARGHVNIARYLLKYGADPNASAAGGIRPIHDAIENNHVEIVRLLLSYGADPTITTYSGASPLKLAKSEQMAEFLKGFFSDINGESSSSSSVWKFHGTSSIFDPEIWGCNVFDNLPPADSDCDEDNIVFEVSDKPHLPTFKLHPPSSSSDLLQPGNYVLLQDVLSDLKTTQEAFTIKHRHINILTLSKNQFIESVTHSQIFPQDDVTSSVSNIDRVQSKTVQLIPLDNDIRNILGVECITVR